MSVNYKKIGERVQATRKMKNMSLAELASQTNYSPKSLALAEGGGATLDLDFVIPICDALGMTPNDLLKGEYKVTEQSPEEIQQQQQLEELQALVAELRGDSPCKDATIFKNADATITEIKQMLVEYKAKEREEAQSSRRKASHW